MGQGPKVSGSVREGGFAVTGGDLSRGSGEMQQAFSATAHTQIPRKSKRAGDEGDLGWEEGPKRTPRGVEEEAQRNRRGRCVALLAVCGGAAPWHLL